MIKFIRELRRREVFRTIGLYVGVCWIIIEAANILVPTFGAPEWILRALIIAAFVGFPIAAVLAWLYDVTGGGIVHETDHVETAAPAFGRRMDFVVIGILTVALALSIYLNLARGPGVTEPLEPVSVLIADFDNGTGESIFDGLLEQALNVGIESASHVMSYERGIAERLARQLQPDSEGLPAAAARLVAVREGVDLVLSGSIDANGREYRLRLAGLDPVTGAADFEVSERAANRDDILAAVGALSEDVREQLGDRTPRVDEAATAETFTAASIEAASAYMEAVDDAFTGRLEDAVEGFRAAVELDPNFGRAYSGWALTESRLGRDEAAAKLWDKALSLMGTMTERERLRTLGVYYAGTRNYAQALENFSQLVEKYPADAAGRNNLAVSAFMTLDFETAAAEGKRVLDMFPKSQLYRLNFALYAMYSGDFEAAAREARTGIEDDPEYGGFYLPLAISLLAMGDGDGARSAYRHMRDATASEFGQSTATLGLADVSIYLGEVAEARQILRAGIEQDLARGARPAAALKHIALAEARLKSGEYSMAVEAAMEALDLSTQDSIKVAAAIVFVEAGELEAARRLADELSVQLNTHSRAYSMMIDGALERRAGDYVDAVYTLGLAADLADLWRIHYERGRAYLEAGFFAEAFYEFENCLERRGQATAMFLDDTPTFRALANLPYWLARSQDGLGMQSAAMENYRVFLDLQPEGGPLAEDARQRSQ